MRGNKVKLFAGSLLTVLGFGILLPMGVQAAPENGWEVIGENWYWYENGVRQGTEGRGKEIFDPGTNAWYWLDAVDNGKKAVSKDVYQESQADDAGNVGKWVRYDEDGHMIKGWDENQNGRYYFDLIYGTMAKGNVTIDGVSYTFDTVTGILQSGGSQGVDANTFGWVTIDGIEYWYENGVRQGTEGRGKEIYDPGTDAWYWLDAIDNGKKAVSKDVYQESKADDAGNIGKWVRYDAEGHMIKGWDTNERGTYYFDPVYGTMAKGRKEIDGKAYYFNMDTGIMESGSGGNSFGCNLSEDDYYYKYEYAYRTGDMSLLSGERDKTFYNSLKECLDEAYKGKRPYDQELAAHDWILLNCKYDWDNYWANTIPSVSYSAEGVFVEGTAVCQGYAEAFQLCMDILGIPCIMVSGDAKGAKGWQGHAWNAVQLEGEWYMVDTTFDDPVPDYKGRTLHTYFNVPDEMLRQNHRYTCEVSANATKFYYYEQAYPVIESGELLLGTAKEWSAGAAFGDTITYSVRCPVSGTEEFLINHVEPLAKTDVLVTGREPVWRLEVLTLQKNESFEQQIAKAEAWAKSAKPCETTTQQVILRYPKWNQQDTLKLYRETLAEKGILIADMEQVYGHGYLDWAGYVDVYSMKLAKQFTYEEYVKEMEEWSAKAKPGEDWLVYFPKDTVQADAFQKKYFADLLSKYGVAKHDYVRNFNFADEVTFSKCFEGDSADPIISYVRNWLKETDASAPALDLYVRSAGNANYTNWDLVVDLREELADSGVFIEVMSDLTSECMWLHISGANRKSVS